MSKTDPIHIMVVDDHPVVRRGLFAIIGLDAGMRVVAEAASGEEAVKMFRQHEPDVTLMDLRLQPGMGGVEAIAAIREEFPASKFVVLTTYDGDEDIYRALQAGAQAYLLKGTLDHEVRETIKAVHRGLRRIPTPVSDRLSERPPNSELTPRELEVLQLIVNGKSNKEIADALGITENTVKWFTKIIFNKLDVRDRTQATTAALQRGIVHL